LWNVTRVLEFESPSTLRNFLAETGLSDQKLKEIDAICRGLQKNHAFHGQMFLPTSVEDRIKDQIHRRAA
jgi:endonuclease III